MYGSHLTYDVVVSTEYINSWVPGRPYRFISKATLVWYTACGSGSIFIICQSPSTDARLALNDLDRKIRADYRKAIRKCSCIMGTGYTMLGTFGDIVAEDQVGEGRVLAGPLKD